jgi:hypothetical protein
MREVVCPRCGKMFECKHNKDCFCMKYYLTPEAKKDIQSKWTECLCEDCLSLFAQPIELKYESRS